MNVASYVHGGIVVDLECFGLRLMHSIVGENRRTLLYLELYAFCYLFWVIVQMLSRHICVTGANGFVGSRLINFFARRGDSQVTGVLRGVPPGGRGREISGLTAEQDWMPILFDVDVLVHCAARVHIMDDLATDPLTEFRRVNVEGTLRMARQAADAGVRRFVFLSSIKVNGERTPSCQPFTSDDSPAPCDFYGISKCEAEAGLRVVSEETGMEVVIIRPPLVYGPGVKGNFLTMIRWLRRGTPLPFGAIYNKRSFVALDNLVDLINTCIDHPAAANQTFLVSDGYDLSTTQLLRQMGDSLGKPAHLVPVPVWMLEVGTALLGKRELAQRLCGNLQVDISRTKDVLGWSPPMSVDEGLKLTAEYYLAEQNAL